MKTRLKNEDPVIFIKGDIHGAGHIRGVEEFYGGILYLIEISSVNDEDYPDSIIAVHDSFVRLAGADDDVGYTKWQVDVMNNEREFEIIGEELKNVKEILVTLITWLVTDLGAENVKNLLDKLSRDIRKEL